MTAEFRSDLRKLIKTNKSVNEIYWGKVEKCVIPLGNWVNSWVNYFF